MIRLTPTPQSTQALTDFFERIERALTPPDAELEQIRTEIRAGFERNFTEEASAAGPWAPLARWTVLERTRLGFGPTHPILVRTGDYAASWLDPGNQDHVSETRTTAGIIEIAEGSQDERADVLEAGSALVPARPVAPLQAPDIYQIEDTITAMLDRLFPNEAGT